MARLYDRRRWRRRSRLFLQANPYCAMCRAAGRVRLAQVVDHVVPHKGDEELFWSESNWQGLCATDHNAAKQSQERTGRIRGCGTDGQPLDPGHHWNMIRPEKLSLADERREADGNAIEGMLDNAAYLGDRSHFYVRVDGIERPIAVSAQNLTRTLDRVGEQQRPVWLCWPNDAVVLLSPD